MRSAICLSRSRDDLNSAEERAENDCAQSWRLRKPVSQNVWANEDEAYTLFDQSQPYIRNVQPIVSTLFSSLITGFLLFCLSQWKWRIKFVSPIKIKMGFVPPIRFEIEIWSTNKNGEGRPGIISSCPMDGNVQNSANHHGEIHLFIFFNCKRAKIEI